MTINQIKKWYGELQTCKSKILTQSKVNAYILIQKLFFLCECCESDRTKPWGYVYMKREK